MLYIATYIAKDLLKKIISCYKFFLVGDLDEENEDLDKKLLSRGGSAIPSTDLINYVCHSSAALDCYFVSCN